MKEILKKGGLSFLLLCVALVMNHRFGYITIISLLCGWLCVRSFWFKTRMDGVGWLLLLYCVLYVTQSAINGFDYSPPILVLWIVAPPIFYYYGKHLTDLCSTQREFMSLWFVILLCYMLDVAVVGLSEMRLTGSFFAERRILSFYDQQIVSATQVALPLNVAMVGLPLALLIRDRGLKVLYGLLTVCALLVVVYLLNRTGIVILMLCLAGAILLKVRDNRRFAFVAAGVILAGSLLLLSCDLSDWEVVKLYQARNEQEGLEARSDRWSEHINYLLTHPFGWAEGGEVYYIHNMWLDIARISGLLPFVMLCCLTIRFFARAMRNAWRSATETNYLVLGLNVCFFASCFVEPIFGGTHFMLYCLLWGCQSSLAGSPQWNRF